MENHEIYTQIVKSVSEGVVVYDKDLWRSSLVLKKAMY
jgi:hypothetical protein